MFSSKQTHMLNCFICHHQESGWHVTRQNQGLSLGRGESLGTRLEASLSYNKIIWLTLIVWF